MIPLGRWLQDRNSGIAALNVEPAPMELEDLVSAGKKADHCEGCEQLAGRVTELEAALAGERQALEDVRLECAARESEYRAELGGNLASRLADVIREGLAGLQHDIESAMCDVLAPFVRREIAASAAAQLVQMFREAIADSSQPLISVRAPAEFHGSLGALIEQSPLSIELLDDTRIELNFQTHTSRFGVLAQRWMECLDGHQR